MPNWCSNIIGIYGEREIIKRLFNLVKSEERDWGKQPSPYKSEEENQKWLCLEFDFNKIVPYSEQKATENGYSKDGYDWHIQNRGTKWNATNAGTDFVDEASFNGVVGFVLSDYKNPACIVEFTTAWEPALPVTEALSKQFPELIFSHNYEMEEGGELGGFQTWKAGNLLEEGND